MLEKQSFFVLVKTGARQTELLGERNGCLHVAIKAQPIEGKANEELLRFLKKETGVVWEIISGETSKKKLVRRVVV